MSSRHTPVSTRKEMGSADEEVMGGGHISDSVSEDEGMSSDAGMVGGNLHVLP